MQAGELIAGALGEDFYAAVVVIADPSGNAQDVSFTFHEPAEADALHPSANQVAPGLNRFF